MSLSVLISLRRIPRFALLILALASLLVLPSCWVYSIEPLYEKGLSHADPDLIFDQSLVGAWTQLDNDCLWILTITANQPAYEMNMAPAPECKTEEKATNYEGHLVKLGSHRFLDVSPRSREVCDLCLPLHTFFLVSQENETIGLVPLDRDWLAQATTDKKVSLTHLATQESYDAITLTASSRELKEFVRKYADDKAAFKPDSGVKLKFKRR